MKNINYLIGSENIVNTPLNTFADDVLEFLNDLSKEIMSSPASRIFPDLMALAFWCRKANLQNIKNKYVDIDVRLGRGLCFHVAPSNIPINFAFSYLFSLLAGNSNIVRLPSKDFPQVDALIEIFKKVLKKYPELDKRTAFVKYERDNEITQMFSKNADCRMVWGGDKTIEILKKMDTKPRCTDVVFADRYSVCVINGEEILNAEETKLKRLAQDFYNDTYLMDQNACSSPQLIYWINDSVDARDKFWNAVLELAKSKYTLQDAVSVDKYTKLCEDAINYSEIVGETVKYDNILYRSEIKKLVPEVFEIRGKGGYFYEYSLNDMKELFDIVTEKYQTITYFGIDSQELAKQIVQSNLRGVDRIVPIGKAMDIDVIWDGHDLVRELSRSIDAR